MPQPDHIIALEMPDDITLESHLDEDFQKYFSICREKIGFVPNVLKAYAIKPQRLKTFANFYNELMLGESGLSKLEREMIAVVVSSINRCYYCLVAHGQAVRAMSGDPELGEILAINYRIADLSEKHQSMLQFTEKLTREPYKVSDADREKLKSIGFTESDIFDIFEVAAFFNMTNRMASALDMMPNKEYHKLDR